MTREEAIADIRDNIKPIVGGISLDMAIEALEQQPCDDCISRQAVLDKIYNVDGMEALENSNIFAKHYADMIKSLPSVTPKEKTGKYDKLKEAVGKIKAEIKAYDKNDRYPYGALGVSTALEIINKHTEGLI